MYSGISGPRRSREPPVRLSGRFSGSAPVSDTFFSKGLDYFTEFDAPRPRMSSSSSRSATMQACARRTDRARGKQPAALSAWQPENTRTTTTVSAEVIARSPGDWADTLTLDKAARAASTSDDLCNDRGRHARLCQRGDRQHLRGDFHHRPENAVRRACHPTRETAIAEGDYNLMTRGALSLVLSPARSGGRR